MMKFLIKNLEEIVSFSLFLSLMGVMGLQVFCRYLLNAPLSWPEELSGYLLVWLALFGAAVGIKRNMHTMIEFVVQKLPKRIRIFFVAAGFLLVGVLLWILIVTGFIVAARTNFPTVTLPFNWTVVYISVPVASFLMFLRLLEVLIASFRSSRSDPLT